MSDWVSSGPTNPGLPNARTLLNPTPRSTLADEGYDRAMDDRQQEHLAANEDLFRRINEKIENVAAKHGGDSHEFLCECSDPDCSERVRVTLEDYRRVRENSARFLVAKGHVVVEIERVIESAHDHAVIEKQDQARRVAIELDTDE
jgi:hypothetical protein